MNERKKEIIKRENSHMPIVSNCNNFSWNFVTPISRLFSVIDPIHSHRASRVQIDEKIMAAYI